MKSGRMLVREFVRDEHGFETVEYAILVGLLVAGTIGAIVAIGVWVNNIYQTTRTDVMA